MLLCFKLSMPNAGSWNGKWSGEGTLYAIIRAFPKKKVSKAEEIAKKGNYHYSFGDGWGACVSVTVVTSQEAAGIRKLSKGFCGYEWMVNSIINNGKIVA
jgi:hypothetical protein